VQRIQPVIDHINRRHPATAHAADLTFAGERWDEED